jgi:hypothetical protein
MEVEERKQRDAMLLSYKDDNNGSGLPTKVLKGGDSAEEKKEEKKKMNLILTQHRNCNPSNLFRDSRPIALKLGNLSTSSLPTSIAM